MRKWVKLLENYWIFEQEVNSKVSVQIKVIEKKLEKHLCELLKWNIIKR